MLAVNYTELRGNLREYMDKVSDDFETLIVTRKKNKNIVMISEETYNNMIENMYLMGNQTNYKWLMESKKQLEDGLLQVKELLEVAADPLRKSEYHTGAPARQGPGYDRNAHVSRECRPAPSRCGREQPVPPPRAFR